MTIQTEARRSLSATVPDIEALAVPTADEFARQRFCSALRSHAIRDLATTLESDFNDRVRPAAERKGTMLVDARTIDQAMEREASYRFYSSVRYNAQEMCFQSVQPQIERALPDMIAVARDAALSAPAGGTLQLDPELVVPHYVDVLDVHLMPGCFHAEHTADDVAQGAVASLGSRVFTANQGHRSWGGVARVIGRWLTTEHPQFAPKRMLDLGTGSGKNLLPFGEYFPGIEMRGVDVAAPQLRYGHALAEHASVPLHFSQQNAETLDFPDGHFDLIVSSFFFHEIPVKVARRVLAECARLLAPGGMMVHQELPSSHLVDAYEDYFWNWDTLNNNEPSYTAWRAEDHVALCDGAGFDHQRSFALILPDPGAYPDRGTAFAWDEPGRPMHGRGGWYVFGSSRP